MIKPYQSIVAAAIGATLTVAGPTAFAWGVGSFVGHVAAYTAAGIGAHEAERYIDHRDERTSRSDEQYARRDAGGVDAQGSYGVVFPESAALPNPRITPGAINPAVTQSNLRETICRPGGYTRSIRPPESYTEPLKRKLIREYGHTDYRMHDYELDHLVPLEAGGAPSDPRNLWPEPHHVIGGWGSYAKDRLENRMHTMICRGQISLAKAQQEIATNWVAAYQRYVGAVPNQSRMHRHRG